MAADSFAEGNYEIFRRGDTLSAVFHETYHADGPDFNNAYRTFTFDMAKGTQLQLADLTKPGSIRSLSYPHWRSRLSFRPSTGRHHRTSGVPTRS